MPRRITVLLPDSAQQKRYTLRPTGKSIENKGSIETVIPYDLIKKEAGAKRMSIQKFIDTFDILWTYTSSDDEKDMVGAHIFFVKKNKSRGR